MVARSGELAMRPLPAVLLDLHEQLATGRLVLKRGRVSKTVDLVSGNPVSMSSSPRDETLGHFLVAGGVISEDQHRAAVAHAARAGVKLGEALVALRSLTIAQLIDQLGMQARHKLVQALRWPQGAWRFDAGDPAAADRPSLARAPTRPPAAGSELFDILFDDLGFGEVTAGNGGAVPIQLEDADDADSGVVSTADVEAASLRSDDAAAARQ